MLLPFCFIKKTHDLVEHVKSQYDVNENNSSIQNELSSMQKAGSLIFGPTIKSYMAHRFRAVAQFAKLKHETMMFTNTICGLMLDHKQKILPCRYTEGQVEYFGKRGMSLLGFMLIRRINKKNKDDVGVTGLIYEFYDVVIKGYSAQDHVQVLAVVEAVVKLIKTDHPEIKSLMLGSDNASCLSLHDLIPYVHDLNKRLAVQRHALGRIA